MAESKNQSEHLTGRPLRPYKIPTAEVSPEMVRDALARRVSGTETPAIAELLARIQAEIFDWYAVRWPSRMRAITLIFEGETVDSVAEKEQVHERTIRKWRASFEFVASQVLTSRIQREIMEDWSQAYCDLTHRSSGGHGGTPPQGRREFMAGQCPACAARRA